MNFFILDEGTYTCTRYNIPVHVEFTVVTRQESKVTLNLSGISKDSINV